jgi:hypothetical protein
MSQMNPVVRKAHLEAATRSGEARSCGTKIRYGTIAEATTAAYRVTEMNAGSKELEPYPCPWCNGYHVGRAYSDAELGL